MSETKVEQAITYLTNQITKLSNEISALHTEVRRLKYAIDMAAADTPQKVAKAEAEQADYERLDRFATYQKGKIHAS